LAFVGHFKEGIPIGFCWKGLVGGSWIYGQVDERGEFTGKCSYFLKQNYLFYQSKYVKSF
jgi:hypothetical protein